MAVYKKVPGHETVNISTLEFDTTPTPGSLNPVTSGGVDSAIDAAKDEMQDKIDEVTLDPSAVALGNVHLLDEVTELPADGVFLVDSKTDGPGHMPKDTLLDIMAKNTLGTKEYKKLDSDVGVYDIGTTYNTLDPTYSRVMAVFPIKDVDSTFVWKISNKSTNGNVNIRITSAPTPYSADLVKSIYTVIADDTEGSGEFTIDAGDKASAKYIIFLNATSNLLVSFDLQFITKKSLAYQIKQLSEIVSSITGEDGQPW